jgi:6-phospho-3-hexuloisomerase
VTPRRTTGPEVVAELAATIARVGEELDWDQVDAVADLVLGARRVFLFGAGRSRAVALAIGQRLTHVGCDVTLIGEAGTSRFTAEDVLIVVSGSGGSPSAVTIAELAAAPGGGAIVALTTAPDSPVGRLASRHVVLPVRSKLRERPSLAPYTAHFDTAAIVVGEALAKLVMEARGLADEDIERHRPNVE